MSDYVGQEITARAYWLEQTIQRSAEAVDSARRHGDKTARLLGDLMASVKKAEEFKAEVARAVQETGRYVGRADMLLDAWQKLLQSYRDFYFSNKEMGGMFKTYRTKDGKARWIGTSSNRFKDRDGEIVSEKALAADVERADKDGDYGPLRWWHVKGLDIGTCDFNTMRDGVLIESGTFLNEDIARWAEKNADDLGLSIGFTHPADQPDGKGVFTNIRRVERSLLPNVSAANPYTNFAVKEAVNLADPKTARKWKTFVTVLFGGDEKAATEYAERVSQTARSLEEKGVEFKEATEKADQFAQSRFERKIETAVTNGRRVVSTLQTAIGAKDKARLPALLRDAQQAFDKLDYIASESRGPGFSGPDDVLQVMDTLEALMRDAERVKEGQEPATDKSALDDFSVYMEAQDAIKQAGLAALSGDRNRMANARTDIGLVYVKVVNEKNRVNAPAKWRALEASVRRQMDSLDRALDASWMSGKAAKYPTVDIDRLMGHLNELAGMAVNNRPLMIEIDRAKVYLKGDDLSGAILAADAMYEALPQPGDNDYRDPGWDEMEIEQNIRRFKDEVRRLARSKKEAGDPETEKAVNTRSTALEDAGRDLMDLVRDSPPMNVRYAANKLAYFLSLDNPGSELRPLVSALQQAYASAVETQNISTRSINLAESAMRNVLAYLNRKEVKGDPATEPTIKEGPATIYAERVYTRASDVDPLAFIKG